MDEQKELYEADLDEEQEEVSEPEDELDLDEE